MDRQREHPREPLIGPEVHTQPAGRFGHIDQRLERVKVIAPTVLVPHAFLRNRGVHLIVESIPRIGNGLLNPGRVTNQRPAPEHRGVVPSLPVALARLVLVDVPQHRQQQAVADGLTVRRRECL